MSSNSSMADALPDGTITFLFTDIEGSTHHWDAHPAEMRVALARHDALLREAITACGGHVFKTIGDAFCAAFATATGALNAALRAQQALIQDDVRVSDTPLRVRMALHTGAAERRDGDYFGPPLNRIARLMAVGHGGQVLLSDVSADLVRDEMPPAASLRFLGKHRLRDLTRPETVFQLAHPDLPDDFPPLRSLDNPTFPNNLPLQITRFIGREKEIAEVKRLLKTTRLLTLTGSGGAGKTRLSLQVAADVLDHYPDGAWLVELAPLTDSALILPTVATTLGVREEPGRPLRDSLTSFLKNRQLLLVLDNCEHLLEGAARLTDALLRACGELTVLTTSRATLGITGELAYRVPSLSLPDPRHIPPVEKLAQYEAVQLFVDRARFGQPTFAVTSANAPAVAGICRHLDGIPLALELAAARVRSLHIDEINERLDNRFRLLISGNRAALPRQQTLRALIDWSYDLLTEPEKTLLDRLSVFADGWTLEAAEQVCGFPPLEEWEVLDLLTWLVDKSLVIFEEPHDTSSSNRTGADEPRYRLLETVRQYAANRLEERDETNGIRQRHLDYFADFARRAEAHQVGPEEVAYINRMEIEHDNLRTALDTGERGGVSEAHLRLVGSLWRFWFSRGYWSEGRERLKTALEKNRDAAPAIRASALYAAGFLSILLNDWNLVPQYLEASLEAARLAGDDALAARAMTTLSNTFLGRDEDRAARLREEAIDLARATGDPVGLAAGLMNRGIGASRNGDFAAARTAYREALELLREVGSPRLIGTVLTRLGKIEALAGETVAAKSLLQEGVAVAAEAHDILLQNETLLALSDLALAEGDYAAAQGYLETMLHGAKRQGLFREIYMSLGRLAGIAYRRGDFPSAHERIRQTLEAARDGGNQVAHSVYQTQQGFLFSAESRFEEAQAAVEAALTALRAGREAQPENIGFLAGEAFALTAQGFIALDSGDPKTARSIFEQAISLWPRREALYSDETLTVLLAEEGMGWLSLNGGDPAGARHFFETAQALCQSRALRGDCERIQVGSACAAMAEGHHSEAAALLRAALTGLLPLDGMNREAAMTLEAVATLLEHGREQANTLALLLDAAEVLWSRGGTPLSIAERQERDALTLRLRAGVGKTDRETPGDGQTDGTAMARQQALSFALSLLPPPTAQ